ncbi:LysR family transcriptional regulator [Neobacillus rhizophilus]|uniref:LysR family transcriptional regulator n=1 Tax=Neobacillus rhizophilus TaxID=2833579 RepID=A0A942U8H0_9BACI|nr:LysR family transcriptional regulator [Neobacillus rhizophilus]MBS4214203.1 LysR family transcriptional regulator [Neobacillus rhizophilus]MBU8916006.1 LysR family transcriptional regulator [Bacillus sp. FJAT-29953]
MDIKQLRYFIAIAEEKNITAAAARLHMSQPPLSMQLKQLEEELGVKLIERNGKGMELTDKGNVLYKHALLLVNSIQEIKNELQETEDGKRGVLSVGINTLSVTGFSEMLQSFHKKYPLVPLKIVQNDSPRLAGMVKSRAIEIAFVRLAIDHRGLTYHHLINENFVFVSSKKIQANMISLKEISHMPLIIPSSEGLGIYNTIFEAFSRQKLQPIIIGECSDMHVLMEMVKGGMGVTIVPKSVLEVYGNSGLYSTPIRDANLISSLGVIWLENHFVSASAKNFIKLVNEYL